MNTSEGIFERWTVRQRHNNETDLSEDAVISRLCAQEALCVTARVSLKCGGTAGGATGSTGQTGRR